MVNNIVRTLRALRHRHQSAGAGPASARRASMMEAVEPRLLFATYTVTSVADGGAGSLREAITLANTNQGFDEIVFNIPGTGVQTIAPATALPAITDSVTLDATTQPGYDLNTMPLIQISGQNIPAGTVANGLTVASSDTETGFASNVLGLIINRFSGNGIVVTGAGNLIGDSFIGTDPTGAAAGGGNGGHGILITGNNNYVYETTVAFNGGDGFAITGASRGNDVSLNTFFANGGLPIDLGDDGPTANDAGDADSGPNNLQNKPVITSVTEAAGGGVIVTATINTLPGVQVELVFYSSPSTDGEAGSEGRLFESSAELVTNGSGNATFTVALESAAATDYITATATTLVFAGDTVDVNTSEVSNAVTARPTTPVGGPKVTDVFVNGSTWAVNFKNALASRGLGGLAGYRIPQGSLAEQLDELPWVNANQIVVTFDQAVTVEANDLVVRGVRGTYVATSVAPLTGTGVAANTYVFTLDKPLGGDGVALNGDKLLVDLNGDAGGVTGASGSLLDGNGDNAAGGDFEFRFNVVQGDVNRNGGVNINDTLETRNRMGQPASGPNYSVFHDVNADGGININDTLNVRNRMGRTLPPASAGEPSGNDTAPASIGDEVLFSDAAILL